MAQRRMFSAQIVDSDSFLDMPLSAQSLYFHLNMRADDDGFINSPKKIQRMIGASEDDLKLLIAKRFIIAFENGVIVIKHWKMHNYIPKDRYKSTVYQEQLEKLRIKSNGAYTERPLQPALEASSEDSENPCIQNDVNLYTTCIQNVSKMDTQVRLGKDRLGKDRLGEEEVKKHPHKKYGEYKHVLLTDDQLQKLRDDYGDLTIKEYIRRVDEYCQQCGKGYKDFNLTIRQWIKKDGTRKSSFTDYTQRKHDYSELEKKVYGFTTEESK